MTIDKLFQRRIEDFTCEHCATAVKGNGYTNHCPKCLWSKHVDIHPGDRAQSCKGPMQPVAVEVKGTQYTILHRCLTCGFERRNRSVAEDDFEALLKVAGGES
ncbi:MAG: RNHCP domain-containing protein [Deltaproteobacteria bacterium]|nr:RNHCP domain-containing protein [Deltaproteobacteria bacterium]